MKNNPSKTGILLLNLGTPDSYEVRSVRRYLSEFLNDPRVIDLPFWIRWPLVNLLIVPFRAKRSAQAYKSIWGKEGAPLLMNSQRLQKALAEKLGDTYQVALGMRYGNPGVTLALEQLKNCRHLYVIPLFPQYASAVTGSVLEQTLSLISTWKQIPSLLVKTDFYQTPWFIEAYTHLIKKTIAGKSIDLFLFSYHGLPERQLNQKSCLMNCKDQSGCPVQKIEHHDCYRAQCYITSHALSKACGISEEQAMTAFQSRLGRTPWIQPYADHLLPNLIQKGIKNMVVVCPSFVSDCLETLEEIGIRMRKRWEALGGGEFILVPCLNDEAIWVDGLAREISSASLYSAGSLGSTVACQIAPSTTG